MPVALRVYIGGVGHGVDRECVAHGLAEAFEAVGWRAGEGILYAYMVLAEIIVYAVSVCERFLAKSLVALKNLSGSLLSSVNFSS